MIKQGHVVLIDGLTPNFYEPKLWDIRIGVLVFKENITELSTLNYELVRAGQVMRGKREEVIKRAREIAKDWMSDYADYEPQYLEQIT